jgi:hypothetical protein
VSYTFVETVVLLPSGGQIRPVGKSFFKKLKRAVTLPKKMNSVKDLKKVLTLKNIISIAASFIIPGIGALIVQAAITASDIAKARDQNKKIKQAAKLANEKDEVAVVQLTESFKALKAESDKFRAARGLKPLDVTLPDIDKSTPEQIEAAFTTLQNDATAIFEAENRPTTSPSSSPANTPQMSAVTAPQMTVSDRSFTTSPSSTGSSSTTPGTPSQTNKTLIYSGIAVVGLGVLYFLTRNRK